MTDDAKEEAKIRARDRMRALRRREREEREAKKLQLLSDEAAAKQRENDQHPTTHDAHKGSKKKDEREDESLGF